MLPNRTSRTPAAASSGPIACSASTSRQSSLYGPPPYPGLSATPPSSSPSSVTASAIRPSRAARFQPTLASSSSRSHTASASSIAFDGGQVNPRGMLLPLAFPTPALRLTLSGFFAAAGAAAASPTRPAPTSTAIAMAVRGIGRNLAFPRPFEMRGCRRQSLSIEGLCLTAAANAFFEREELRTPRCHRAAKLVDLRFWRMDLEPDDLRDLQRLANQFSDVLAMCEQGGGVYVSLATVGEVAAERERVVHATRLRARLGDELQRQRFESVELPVLDLEVR